MKTNKMKTALLFVAANGHLLHRLKTKKNSLPLSQVRTVMANSHLQRRRNATVGDR